MHGDGHGETHDEYGYVRIGDALFINTLSIIKSASKCFIFLLCYNNKQHTQKPAAVHQPHYAIG